MSKLIKKIFFVDGVRTPFQMSGTGLKDHNCYDLGKIVLNEISNKLYYSLTNKVDYVVMGNVIQDSKTTNVARESMLLAKYNNKIPSYTVSMACISSNKSITEGFNLINANQASSVIAGGVETMSDTPIKLSQPLRKMLLESRKWKSVSQKINGLSKIKVKDIGIEVPSITEFSTNETMGFSADKLAEKWGVSRQEQDEYAYRSHKMASDASNKGYLTDVIKMDKLTDNIIKHDTTMMKLKKLNPVFRKNGTITPGNASSLSDGASACLLADQKYINENKINAKSEILDYIYIGTDPKDELLLGPAYAIARLLEKNNIKLTDIDVFEIHEAFAGQVLANLNALDSDKFTITNNLKNKIGRIPIDKLNNYGGSLSLGHPFGATGVRLFSHASQRLIDSNGDLALIASCAAGGLGHAILIKNVHK